MCFGRAIWLGRSLSRNTMQCYCRAIGYHCGFAAYRKPPLVNMLPSDYPIHLTVLVQKRRNSCDITRTTLDASCAATVTQFLYARSALVFRQLPKLCARELHKLVRRHARAVRTAVVRLGDEGDRLSFERSGGVLCTDPPASAWTSVANCCSLRAGCCRTVCMGWCKTSGKVHSSFEIQTAWSICTAARAVLRKDAHQMHAAVDSGSN